MTERELLFSLQDLSYRDFHAKLMPTVDKEKIIGVRVPLIRKRAKEITEEEAAIFIKQLPHRYYEENNLHAFIIAEIKDFDLCIKELDRFLPYVDNWATCDGLNPKILGTEPERLMKKILLWLKSDETYTVRFAVKCLMDFYLDKSFTPEVLKIVSQVRREDYYIRMVCAWFFATALAKRPDEALPFFTDGKLDKWVHNKAISKACESLRVAAEMKTLLRSIRIK